MNRSIWRTIVDNWNETKRGARTATVASNPGGNPLGSPPGLGDPSRGVSAWAGGNGWMDGRGVTPSFEPPGDSAVAHRLPAHRPAARILADVFTGVFQPSYAENMIDAPRPAQDIIGNRHTRTAIDSYASLKQWGSSDVASGPSGTRILVPPRLPRQLATPRAIAGAKRGNQLLNYANSHTQTPNVPVVSR